MLGEAEPRVRRDLCGNLPRRATAEAVGTAQLQAAVVGSGIKGSRLAGGQVAVALLANTVATGAAPLCVDRAANSSLRWRAKRRARWCLDSNATIGPSKTRRTCRLIECDESETRSASGSTVWLPLKVGRPRRWSPHPRAPVVFPVAPPSAHLHDPDGRTRARTTLRPGRIPAGSLGPGRVGPPECSTG